MSTIASTAEAARRELGSSLNGELIGPDDASYNEGRAVFNAMIDRRPALIVRPTDTASVSAAVGFGRSHDLPIAVRGGGHNGGGLGVVDDGIVIDLSSMDTVAVDPGSRTVRVGGGATWGKVDAATNQHGMATPSGIISTTGVGGLTLGGGIGHLTRGYGLSIDSLLEAEVVLASGEIVTASADENTRPVLGAARRRRQLRRGHVVHVPHAPGVQRDGRSDVLADRAVGARSCSGTASSSRRCRGR